MADVLVQALAPAAPKLRLAFVFGSVAQGRETAGSDIGLMLIGDISFREVVELLFPVQTTLGREVNPKVYSAVEFSEKAPVEPFLADVLAKPKIFLIDADEVEPGVYKIKDMVEKPAFADAPSDLAIIGRYIFTPDIFEAIEQTAPGAGGEIQITDAMRLLLRSRPFYAVKLDGTRHDAGDKLGFLIATVEYALKREDLGGEFREYLKGLKLDD